MENNDTTDSAPKRVIVIEVRVNGFTVREGDKFCPELCWDEMLGSIAELTHPRIGACRYRMFTTEEHAAYEPSFAIRKFPNVLPPGAPVLIHSPITPLTFD